MSRAADVAVVIPTFERARWTARAVRSVLAQTLQAHEIVVVDDGSSAACHAELEEELAQFPAVRLQKQPRQGVSAARNRGVAATTAPWIAFLDSDDEWRSEKLERQMGALALHPDMPLVHCDEIWIRNGNQVLPRNKHRKSGGRIFSRSAELCCISPSAAVLRRDLFDELGGFDESFQACEDYDLWLRVTSRHAVLFVDLPLVVKYGGHADQLSKGHHPLDTLRLRALAKLLADPLLVPEVQAIAISELQRKVQILVGGARKRGQEAFAVEIEKRYGAWITPAEIGPKRGNPGQQQEAGAFTPQPPLQTIAISDKGPAARRDWFGSANARREADSRGRL